VTITHSNVKFAKRIFFDRLGDDHVYGGTWDPNDRSVGCGGPLYPDAAQLLWELTRGNVLYLRNLLEETTA